MRLVNRRRIVAGIAGIAASAVLVGAGFFVGAGVAGAVQSSFSTFGIRNIKMVTQTSDASITATTWQTLTTQSFSPSASARVIRVRFTGESGCSATSWCSVRILVNNADANPVTGTDFAFDSGPGADQWEFHTMERISTNVTSNNPITVQWTVVGSGSFTLDDWSLSIEALE